MVYTFFRYTAGIMLLLFSTNAVFAQQNPDASWGKTDRKLTQKLQRLVDSFHGRAGIYVYNLKTHREAAVNADTVFPTASIVKVPILVGVFKKIQEGQLSYHQLLLYRDSMAYGGSGIMQYFKDSSKTNVSVAVSLMLSRSDNTAAHWCQTLAGGGEAINSWLSAHGFKDTRVNSHTPGREQADDIYGWGQTTPREMAHLLVLIREDKILTPAACERMYRDMTHVYWDDYALSQIPPYIQAASKQGMVNASRSELVMVNAPHGDYVFYVATKDNKDQRWKPNNEAWQFARDVSALLWHYFEPKSKWQPAKGYEKFWDWNG